MNGQTAGVADEDTLRNSKTLPHADFVHSVAEHVNTLPGVPAPTPADEAVMQAEASVQDCSLTRPAQWFPPEDELEAVGLLEMRYQQHLAQSELQELFENGALQALES
jgi:hypothetical protein